MEDFWKGKRASKYEERVTHLFGGYSVLHELACHVLESNLTDGARILVAGAGTGAEIVRMAQRNPSWHFTGFDPSASMLEVAHLKCVEAGVLERVSLILGEVHGMPIENKYDAATSLLVMHFLPDNEAGKSSFLKEISQRLKVNAPFVIADLLGSIGSAQFVHQSGVWEKVMDERSQEPRRYDAVRDSIHLVSDGRFSQLLREAGFDLQYPFFQDMLMRAFLYRLSPSNG